MISPEEYILMCNENLVECDRILQKMLFEIRERKTVLYNEDLIRAIAELMIARAAYAERLAKDNDLFVITTGGQNNNGMVRDVQ